MHITNAEQFNDQSLLTTSVLGAAAKFFGQGPSQLAELVSSDQNNDSPDRDQQVGIWGFPTHQSPQGLRVSARNPVIAVLNATNADGSKTYNLTLSTKSFVTRVLFDTSYTKPKALGVEYLSGLGMYAADPRYNAFTIGTTLRAYARKEVILAGGTFNTPSILKHSGIGPQSRARKLQHRRNPRSPRRRNESGG
jgi:choline dehydrogenase